MVRVLRCTDALRLRSCGETRTFPSGPRVELLSNAANCEVSVTSIAGAFPPLEITELRCLIAVRTAVGLSNGGA